MYLSLQSFKFTNCLAIDPLVVELIKDDMNLIWVVMTLSTACFNRWTLCYEGLSGLYNKRYIMYRQRITDYIKSGIGGGGARVFFLGCQS